MRILFLNLLGLLCLSLLGACTSAPLSAAKGSAQPTMARAERGVPAPAADSTSKEADPGLESARRSVHSAAVWLASGVDSWFGDIPFKDGGKVTDGQLSMSLLKRQDASADFNLRFNGRFSLPNVEQRTYLFIGRDNPREIISDKPAAFSRQQQLLTQANDDRAFFAGLGRSVSDSVDFRLGFRGGLNPYVQGRYRRPWTLGPADEIEFRETLFWSVKDHFGSTTALSYQHAFSPALAGRWLSAATVTQADSKFEWHSSLGAYQSFGNQRLLSLELLANGKQGSGVAVTDYGVQTRWEQPFRKQWLLGELVLGHFWPRPDLASPRGRAWAIGAGLKMKF